MNNNMQKAITVSVIGLSGTDTLKGQCGVGKSLLCNRFVRGSHDDFYTDHSSTLSQTDFFGSPVINSEHWLLWGERILPVADDSIRLRLVEHTEFCDDETFEPLAGSSSDAYSKRATRTKLESRDKLMYIHKEQLGLEAEFPQWILPEGKTSVDAFVFVWDLARVDGRSFDRQAEFGLSLLKEAMKTKRPVVVAAAKADAENEEGRRMLSRLLARKELKGAQIVTVVEVSSLKCVNVDEVFLTAAVAAAKLRSPRPLKPLPYPDAFRIANEHARMLSLEYSELVSARVRRDDWPQRRVSWQQFEACCQQEQHPSWTSFRRQFGGAAARSVYTQHVAAIREYWMQARLHALLPSLSRVLPLLIDSEQAAEMGWREASAAIQAHPLFHDYFQPIGQLGRQLDPTSPSDPQPAWPSSGSLRQQDVDTRIPAEILLGPDARGVWEQFQRETRERARREQLEEDFEQLLKCCDQVTPGRPLHEVSLFLQGHASFDHVPPSVSEHVYQRHQSELTKRAEAEFGECLLEHVDLFAAAVRRSRGAAGGSAGAEERELAVIRAQLQEDVRFRQLSRLFELREKMISRWGGFLARPLVQQCPARGRCADAAAGDVLAAYFTRRAGDWCAHCVEMVAYGEPALVRQFVTDIQCVVRGEAVESGCGLVEIRCLCGEEEEMEGAGGGAGGGRQRTRVHLIDSVSSLTAAQQAAPSASALPDLYVLVCDPAHYDLMPYLHQQGTLLADSSGGIFVSAGSSDSATVSSWSRDSDQSTIFCRDQLLRICEAACASQLDGRKADLRVQVSLLCGDPYPLDAVLSQVLFAPGAGTPLVHPNLVTVGCVPSDVRLLNGQRVRVDCRFSSYHSWLAARAVCPAHAHVVVYSTRRAASFSHARAAVSRILDDGARSLTGRAIMLVAVTERELGEGQDSILLSEGRELACAVGARLVCVEGVNGNGADAAHDYLAFLEEVHHISHPIAVDESDGYATLAEMRGGAGHAASYHNPYATYKSAKSGTTELSTSSSVSNGSRQASPRHTMSLPVRQSGSVSLSHLGMQSSYPSVFPAACIVTPPTHPESAPNLAAMRERSEVERSPRRRAAPLLSPLRLPHQKEGGGAAAPLATPEAIEIAPEYSVVMDAREPLYEMLNGVELEYGAGEARREKERGKEGKAATTSVLQTRARLESVHSSQSIDATASPSSSLSIASHQSGCARPRRALLHQLAGRSRTMDSIARAAVEAAQAAVNEGAGGGGGGGGGGMRHSQSVESLVEGKKRRGASRFVRKVASSFRVKKDHLAVPEGDDGSRSLPQSPRFGRKKAATVQITSSASEKTGAFSWLPSRSPRRTPRTTSVDTNGGGVIGEGESLDSLCSSTSNGLPLFLTRCVEYIEKEGGLELEGLYRVPGNQSQLAELEKAFVQQGDVDLWKLDLPVHVVATAVKNFFSCLPEPLLPGRIHGQLIGTGDREGEEQIDEMRCILSQLSPANIDTLRYFCAHLKKVASSPATAMDSVNLSRVWFPTLFRPEFTSFEEMTAGTAALQKTAAALFQHSDKLF